MEKRLPLPAGIVLQGRYRIARQLGHGGFGAVYEAVDDDLNLSFALKETFYAANEELRQAFKREARMLARLSHDAFPRVTHYFTEGDGCFLVMELIAGDDLDKLLSQRAAPFDEEQILTWTDQILDALEDLHASGIIHRDIKPSNLKLTPKGKIKLLDFGIAKGAVEGETEILTTVGSLAAATIQYAPLEQVLKASQQYQIMLSVVSPDKVSAIMQRGTDAASDLYALAATLYHLLTGQLPADAPTRALAVWSGQKDRLIPAHQINAQIKREVSEVLQKAMSLDRANRYKSATEMRQMLQNAERSFAEVKPIPVVTEPAPTMPSPAANKIDKQIPKPQPLKAAPVKPAPKIVNPGASNQPKSNKKLGNHRYWIVALLFASSVIIVSFMLVFKNYSDNTQSADSNSDPKKLASKSPDYKYELAQTLTNHSDDIFSLAFSPDGKTFASASDDKTIKLWDTATGNLKQTFTGHSLFVRSVAFSPDGKTLASGSADRSIKLWDVASGTLKKTLTEHKFWVVSLNFSSDGKTLASASHDKTIKLWDTATGALKQTLTGHNKEVESVAFSPDGKTIVSGSLDNTIKLWDIASGSVRQTLENAHSVTSVAFSSDGKLIVSGCWDSTIKLWDAATGSLKQTLTGHSSIVHSVAFSQDAKTIASGGIDNTVKIWDAASGTVKQTLTGHSEWVYVVIISPDGKTIVSGGRDNTVKVWRAQ